MQPTGNVQQEQPPLFTLMKSMRASLVSVSPSEAQDQTELLYSTILHDPRYIRLRSKWKPKFNKDGLKQRAKNYVDPSHIPLVGTYLKFYRSKKLYEQNQDLKKIRDDASDEALKGTLNIMQNGLRIEAAKNHAGCVMSFIPINMLLPFGVGSTLQDGIEKATVFGTKKVTAKVISDELPENYIAEVNQCFGSTKAFIIYLGSPQTDEPAYSSWEAARISLKESFGATAKDDLTKLEPTSEVEKQIEAMEEEGGYDLQQVKKLNLSLLILLWRAYDCWSDQYYDRIRGKDHAIERENEFLEGDKLFVEQHFNLFADDKKIRILDVSYREDMAALLDVTYCTHSRFMMLSADAMKKEEDYVNDEKMKMKKKEKSEKKFEELVDKARKKRHVVLTAIATLFIDQNAAWGLFDDKHQKLLAVALILPPHSPNSPDRSLPDLSNLLRKYPKLMLKIKAPILAKLNKLMANYNHAFETRSTPHDALLYFFGDGVALSPSPTGSRILTPSARTVMLSTPDDPSQERPRLQLIRKLLEKFPFAMTCETVSEQAKIKQLENLGFETLGSIDENDNGADPMILMKYGHQKP